MCWEVPQQEVAQHRRVLERRAHFGGRKSARRGCRGRRGTRGLLQREISTGRNSSSTGDSLLGAMCHCFPTQPSCPPGLETPYSAEELRPSCVVHMDSESVFFCGRGAGSWAFTCCGWYVLLQARGATVHSERRHSNSCTGNQLPSSSKCFFTQQTHR